MLPVEALAEILVEQFLPGRYQSRRVDHTTTSSTNFCPMRPTLIDTYRDRMKQHTNNKRAIKSQRIRNCANTHPPTHGAYSVE